MPPLELALFEAINAGPSTAPLVIAGARWISQQLPLAMGGVLLAGFMLGSAAQRRTLLLAAASMALAWVAVQMLRQWVPAPRPAQLGMGMQWVEHAARSGFPSMHTAGAFALAAALTLGRMRPLALLGWVVAFAMAWSRVSLGVHFPSDVAAGALTGVVSAWGLHAAASGLQRRRTRHHAPPLPARQPTS